MSAFPKDTETCFQNVCKLTQMFPEPEMLMKKIGKFFVKLTSLIFLGNFFIGFFFFAVLGGGAWRAHARGSAVGASGRWSKFSFRCPGSLVFFLIARNDFAFEHFNVDGRFCPIGSRARTFHVVSRSFIVRGSLWFAFGNAFEKFLVFGEPDVTPFGSFGWRTNRTCRIIGKVRSFEMIVVEIFWTFFRVVAALGTRRFQRLISRRIRYGRTRSISDYISRERFMIVVVVFARRIVRVLLTRYLGRILGARFWHCLGTSIFLYNGVLGYRRWNDILVYFSILCRGDE